MTRHNACQQSDLTQTCAFSVSCGDLDLPGCNFQQPLQYVSVHIPHLQLACLTSWATYCEDYSGHASLLTCTVTDRCCTCELVCVEAKDVYCMQIDELLAAQRMLAQLQLKANTSMHQLLAKKPQ